ncbi:hypothetical protein [Paraburkholderia lacunae]|nr:hypothetical protein [Paraburkholderia lacunae]
MKNHSLDRVFKLCVVASAVLLAAQANADSENDRESTEHNGRMPLTTG